MRIIVDTCIVIDAVQKRLPFYEDAKELFELVQNEKVEGCITVKALTDVHYVIKHCVHDEIKTRIIVDNICQLLTVLDSKKDELNKALESEIKDFEDALMYETAYANEVSCIVTRNLKDFEKEKDPIAVMTPREFVKFWEKLC